MHAMANPAAGQQECDIVTGQLLDVVARVAGQGGSWFRIPAFCELTEERAQDLVADRNRRALGLEYTLVPAGEVLE